MQSETVGKLVSEETNDDGKQENNSSGGELLRVELFPDLKASVLMFYLLLGLMNPQESWSPLRQMPNILYYLPVISIYSV
jgi:hypothetical protein